ncbi:hypothetical protein E8E13_005560 [Curvularia kusanoi]|uniref:Rhodopsin domain-containing protein n=1 Tax=Curvularia kusanoi TaxID=90978 RepID=A0A9P4TLF6_CURKU|nr:hypothetical protein E8E13_005560 [Curvularia kusanoi]
MQIITSIVIQFVLLIVALVVTLLRCYIRIFLERRTLTLPDWLVWGGWFGTLGFGVGSIVALNIQRSHPLVEPDLVTDSKAYLKTVFVMCYFFDFGLYFPKVSLVAFYWWLIPLDNWSLDNQLNSTWNSFTALISNWALNWSTDLLLFILPFFIINCLKLRKRQKIALCGVFSLGLITMAISLGRLIIYAATDYSVDDASGNLWCTAEMCTAVIVVSLPSLKTLIMRSSPNNSSYPRSTDGYLQHGGSAKPLSHQGQSRSHVQAGRISDDELELVFQGSRNPSQITRSTTQQDSKDNVMVTTEWNVTSSHVV